MKKLFKNLIVFLSCYGLLGFHFFELKSYQQNFSHGIFSSNVEAGEGVPEKNIHKENHEMEGSGTVVWEQYMAALTLLVVSVFATAMPFGCAGGTAQGAGCAADVWVSVASAVIFVAGEMVAFYGYLDAMKELKAKLNIDCDNNDKAEHEKDETTGKVKNKCTDKSSKQFDILRTQKASYEKIKEIATYKLILQAAASAGWIIAAVIAFWPAAAQKPIAVANETIIATATASVASAQSAGTLGTGAAAAATCTTKSSALIAEINRWMAIKISPAKEMSEINACLIHQADVQAMFNTTKVACAGAPDMLPVLEGTEKSFIALTKVPFCTSNSTQVTEKKAEADATGKMSQLDKASANIGTGRYEPFNKQKIKLFLQTLISSANAQDDGKIHSAPKSLFWVNFLLPLFISTLMGLGGVWDGMFSKPITRGIFYTVFAGLAVTVSLFTLVIINKMQNNIDDIDRILNNSGVEAQNIKTEIGDVHTLPIDLMLSGISGETIDFKGDTAPCPGEKDKNGNCMDPPNLEDPKFGIGNIPGDLRSGMRGITSLAKSVGGSKTFTKAQLKNAGSIVKNAAGFRRRLNELKQKINSGLPKNQNIDGVVDSFSAKTKAAVVKALRDNNTTAAKALGGLGGTQSLPDDLKKGIEEDYKKVDQKSLSDSAAAAVSPGVPDFNLNLKDNSFEPVVDAAAGDAALDGLDIQVDDIAADNGNIFDIISIRYKKSAYPTFFNEVEVPSVPDKSTSDEQNSDGAGAIAGPRKN